MYRQHLNELEGEWFMSRVCELPVVNSAMEQLTALYSGVKQHNRLFHFTLATAEGGMQMVFQTARPVISKFDKPIGTLNTIACQQLDKLEQNYPIITKPVEEVLQETKQMCSSAMEPLVHRVGAVKQFGVDKVTCVKTCATDTVTGMKEYGMNSLTAVSDLGTKQLACALDMPVCHKSASQLGMILDVADQYVDSLLPENEEDVDAVANENSVVDDDVQEKDNTVMTKATNLSSKVRRRMYGRIVRQLRGAKLRTKETVERLHFTVDLIEYSRGMMSATVNKAAYVWTEINKSEEEVARELTDEDAETSLHATSNFERRAIATARHITQKTKDVMASVGLPRMIQPVHDLMLTCVAVPSSVVQNLSSLGKHTVGVFSQYHVFVTEKYTSWFGWIVTTTPVKTVAPVFGGFVTRASPACTPLPASAMELTDMACDKDASKELLAEYSSSDGPDDDSQPDDN